LGTPTLVGAEIYNINRNWYDDFIEGRRGGAIRLGRRLRWPDNYFRLYLRYRLEDVRYYDFDDSYRLVNGETVINSRGESVYIPYSSSLLNFNEEWLRTSSISFTIERDSRDLPIFATSGSAISYTGEVSGGILGGRWEYYKHLFVASKYIPIKWGIALIGSAKFGYISAANNDLIPYSERFTPGGTDPDGNVRGYPDASVSPRNIGGSLLGGMSEVIYNAQLQFPILKGQLYTMLFADAGAAYLSKNEIRPFSHLYKGVGVGFRLVIPGVGVIGFDFAYPLDEMRGETKGWRPHFQISQGY
jgi:outer membrane protein insertion porin family